MTISCVVIGFSWSSTAGASYGTPPLVFSNPATNPTLAVASRVFAASAGDSSGTRVVLYGGEAPAGATARADTWVNEPDGTWQPQCGTTVPGATAPCGPGARAGLGMADAPGGVVLFGGFPANIGGNGPNAPGGDTWRWNGSTWTRVCTTATCGPGGRGLMAMAGNGSSAVMYGGFGDSGVMSDTWVFDGSTWTQTCGQNGSPCGPTPLAGASMAWDGHHYVMFGGADLSSNGVPVDDTWIFNGASWTKVCGTSMGRPCGPAARDLSGFAFANNPDPALRGAVMAEGGDLFGSGNTQHLDRDAWFFDGAHWSQLDPPWNGSAVTWSNNGSPPPGPDPILGVMAAKPALCQVVYFAASVSGAVGSQPTLRQHTYVVGRPEASCQPTVSAVLAPTAQPGALVANTPVADPSSFDATAATEDPALAMTGPHALTEHVAFGLLFVAAGCGLVLAFGTRRRAAT